MNSKHKNWVWTFHNYTDVNIEQIKKTKYSYINFGKEICPTTGTKHLQGYSEFVCGLTRTAFQKRMGQKIWCESAKGSAKQNKIYTSKDGLVYEDGIPKKMGKRKDIDQIREVLKSGGNMRQIVDVANSLQSVKMAEIYLKYKEKSRTRRPIVWYFFGATGTGKSYLALKLAQQIAKEDIYTHSLSEEKWWDGYDGHKVVILNDIRGSWCRFSRMLNILDETECRIEHKGGTRQLLAEHIFITSSKPPEELYPRIGEDINQLTRRIKHTYDFTGRLELLNEIKTARQNCSEVG